MPQPVGGLGTSFQFQDCAHTLLFDTESGNLGEAGGFDTCDLRHERRAAPALDRSHGSLPHFDGIHRQQLDDDL